MIGRRHLEFGLLSGVLIAALSEPKNILAGSGIVLVTAIGSLVPDIDSRTSTIGSIKKVASFICGKVFGHRGFLHSPLCVAILWVCGYFVLYKLHLLSKMAFLNGFMLGYSGHLFLDMLTRGGIPLFYPLSRKKIALTRVRSGSDGELGLFLGFLIMFSIILLIWLARDTI